MSTNHVAKDQNANESSPSPGLHTLPKESVENNLEAAVEFISTLSHQFNWVGIYLLKNGFLELGPYKGAKSEHTRIEVGRGICGRAVQENRDLNIADVNQEENYLSCSLETKSELVILIRTPQGEVVGQIDIDSHTHNAFDSKAEARVREVAEALGKNWDKVCQNT